MSLDEKLARFQTALETFLDRVREDRCILAVVLVGSLNRETIWRKEGVYLWVVERDGVTKRLRSDGKDERIFRTLVDEGVNLHAEIIPRSRFKLMVEGASRTAFSCNFFAKRELLYCEDPSIEGWFAEADVAATKDQEKELLATSTWAIYAHRHALRVLDYKQDLELARQEVLCAAHGMAALEVVAQGEVFEHTVIYRAMELRPELFREIYTDVLPAPPQEAILRAALDRIQTDLESRIDELCKPLLHYLSKSGRAVPLSELCEHFAYTQLYPWHLEAACEWLERRGRIEKFSSPYKLTNKSRVDVEEPAYIFESP